MNLRFDFEKHKEAIFLFMAYLIIAIIVTWPLFPNFLTCFPSDGEDTNQTIHEIYLAIDNFKNFSSHYFDSSQFYPFGSYLYHILSPLLSFSVAILYLITRHFIFSLNIFLILTMMLAAFFSYKLINYFCKDKIASFTGSLLFAFCTKQIIFLRGVYQKFMTMFIPFFIYRYIKFLDEKKYSWRDTAILAGITLLLFFSEPYIFIMTMLFIPIAEIWLFIKKRKEYFNINDILKRWGKIAVMLSPAAILSVYFIIMAEIKGFATPNTIGWMGADFAVLDPLSMIVKDKFNTIKFPSSFEFILETNIYIGIGVFLIIIFACIIKKIYQNNNFKTIFYYTVMYFLFAFGPLLRVAGHNQFEYDTLKFNIPIPSYFILHAFPFLRHFRHPSRFAIIAILFLAIIFAIALEALFSNFKKNTKNILIVLIGIFLIVDHLYIPIYLEKYDPPQVFQYLQKQPKGTMLYLPYSPMVADRYLFKANAIPHGMENHIFLYQNIFEKDMIFGYTGRTENSTFYNRNHQILDAFYYTLADDPSIAPYLDSIPENDRDNFMQIFNLKYVLLGSPAATPLYMNPIKRFFSKYIVDEKWFYSEELENQQMLFGNTDRGKNIWKDYNGSMLYTMNFSVPDKNIIKINDKNYSFYLCYIWAHILTEKEREELYFVFPGKDNSKKIKLICEAIQGDYNIYINNEKRTVNFPTAGYNIFEYDIENSESPNNIKGRIVPLNIDKTQEMELNIPDSYKKFLPISIKSFGIQGNNATDNSVWFLNQDCIKTRNNSIKYPYPGINVAAINPSYPEPIFFQSYNINEEEIYKNIKNILLKQPDDTIVVVSSILKGTEYLSPEIIDILKTYYGAKGNYNKDNIKGFAYIFVGMKNNINFTPIELFSPGKLQLEINKNKVKFKDLTRKIYISEAQISN